MRIIWQTERRITNEILGVRGLTVQTHSGIELIYVKKKKKKQNAADGDIIYVSVLE